MTTLYEGSDARLNSDHSNARLRGASSRSSGNKSPAPQSPIADDSQQNTPTNLSQSNLSHNNRSQSNLSQGSQSSTSLASKLPPLPVSPSLSQSIGSMASGDDVLKSYNVPNPLPLWLNPAYSKHIVKGNFMTLSARPKTVEPGEWISHQGKLLSLPP